MKKWQWGGAEGKKKEDGCPGEKRMGATIVRAQGTRDFGFWQRLRKASHSTQKPSKEGRIKID